MLNEMSSIFAQVLVFLNSTGIIVVAYFMGRLVQRLKHVEDDMEEVRGHNTQVALAQLKIQMGDALGRLDRLHTGVHDLRNEMMRFMGKVVD
jgi:hypothetical protein